MNLDSNPWLALPTEAPFVLDADRATLDTFNQKAKADHRIELSLLPEPCVGRTDAPIVLLLLNPGVSDDDFALHQQADFRERVRACHRRESAPYPNYYLDPAVTGPGARWMARVLRPLLAEFGAQTVSNGVTSYEYFPYHTRRFAHHRVRVPSQEYTIELLRSAIRRDAAIFITRGKAIWEAAVPELARYARAFCTRSVQNVVISPRNCPEGYVIAQAALRPITDRQFGQPVHWPLEDLWPAGRCINRPILDVFYAVPERRSVDRQGFVIRHARYQA